MIHIVATLESFIYLFKDSLGWYLVLVMMLQLWMMHYEKRCSDWNWQLVNSPMEVATIEVSVRNSCFSLWILSSCSNYNKLRQLSTTSNSSSSSSSSSSSNNNNSSHHSSKFTLILCSVVHTICPVTSWRQKDPACQGTMGVVLHSVDSFHTLQQKSCNFGMWWRVQGRRRRRCPMNPL